MAATIISQIRVRCEQCAIVFLSQEEFAQHDCMQQANQQTDRIGSSQETNWGSNTETTTIDATTLGITTSASARPSQSVPQLLGEAREFAMPVHWSKEATLELIRLYQDNEANFNSGLRRKKLVWQDIASALQRSGHIFTWQQVVGRWKTLTTAYRRTIHRNMTSVDRRDWPFFQELCEVFGRRRRLNYNSDLNTELGSSHKYTKKRAHHVLDHTELVDWLDQYEDRHERRTREYLDRLEKMHREKVSALSELVNILKSYKK